jgi:hypothetical protein
MQRLFGGGGGGGGAVASRCRNGGPLFAIMTILNSTITLCIDERRPAQANIGRSMSASDSAMN